MNRSVLCATAVNYMEDYSLMGFVVDHCSDAIGLFLSEVYQVEAAGDTGYADWESDPL